MLNGASEILRISYRLVAATATAVVSAAIVVAWLHAAATAIVATSRT